MFRWLQATMWIHVVENFTTSSNDHAWSDNSTGLVVEFFWMERDPESGIQCQCPCQFLEGHIIWCICWDVPHLHHRFCWNLPATTHSRTMFGLFLWRAHLKLNCKLLGSWGKVHVLIQFRTIHDIWFPINISFSILQGMFVVSCISTAHNSLAIETWKTSIIGCLRKHLNVWGYITPEIAGKFPGYLSPSAGLKFADVPNGLAAISKVLLFGRAWVLWVPEIPWNSSQVRVSGLETSSLVVAGVVRMNMSWVCMKDMWDLHT